MGKRGIKGVPARRSFSEGGNCPKPKTPYFFLFFLYFLYLFCFLNLVGLNLINKFIFNFFALHPIYDC